MSIAKSYSYLNSSDQQPSSLINIIKAQHTKCEMSSKEIVNQFNHSPKSISTEDQSILSNEERSSKQSHSNEAMIPNEYLEEIWTYLISIEHEQDYSYNWIHTQPDINDKMRFILVDWLIDIHYRLKLKQDTLYLAINIIDRFITKKAILRTQFQLLGIGAFFIACKYEEIICPHIGIFIDLTDKTYSKSELLDMENDILSTLSFSLTLPSSLNFFELITIACQLSHNEFLFGCYLMEMLLCDARFAKYSPSITAIAISYIIMKLTNKNNYKSIQEMLNGNCSYNQMKTCAMEIYGYVEKDRTNQKAVYGKYSSDQYNKIAVTGIVIN